MYDLFDTYEGEEYIGSIDRASDAFELIFDRIKDTDGECAFTFKTAAEPVPDLEDAINKAIEKASERYFEECDFSDDDYVDRSDYSDEFYD